MVEGRHFIANTFLIVLLLCSKAYLFFPNVAVAQTSKQSSYQVALTIGDKVPDLEFANTVNYGKGSMKLSDFRGKHIILDFWATWCSSCIDQFPKMDSFQKEFGKKIQIILVNTISNTRDDASTLNSFFKRWQKRRADFILPFVIYDSITEKLFPHRALPHYVWIDKNGYVRAVTSSKEFTRSNLDALVKGTLKELPLKKDDTDIDFQRPLFLSGNGANAAGIKYRSILTGRLEGLSGKAGYTFNDQREASRIYCINLPILGLYKHAIRKIRQFPVNRFVLNVKEPDRYYNNDADDDWKIDNTYVYELIRPVTTLDNISKEMKEDLDRYFNLKTGIEKRKIKCLILKKSSLMFEDISKDQEPDNNLFEKVNAPRFIYRQPITYLINRLNDLFKTPIIDETGYKGNVNMKLPADLSNLETLKLALKKYGLELVEEERELELFIINELKNK